jgi:hypothetical protein
MPVKKQLRKVVKGFFDVPTLMAHLNAEDPLALVIRGHLYVEAVLIKQIESAPATNKAFDKAKLNFPTKVKRAVALGKVDSGDVAGFTELNHLRNRFAHNVKMTLTKDDELKLYNVLSPNQRKMIDAPRTAEPMFLRQLRLDIIGLIASAAKALKP